jgi:penicillin-binding protein 1A
MYNQGYLTLAEYQQAVAAPLPPQQDVIPPSQQLANPGYGYFTSWVEQQVLDDSKQLPGSPYTSGYRIHTTFDEPLQNEAQRVIDSILPEHTGLPEASLVAINNANGGVMAMVGGYNSNMRQFNLATQAERQPGSAWKVFELAKALELGVSPYHVYPSGQWTYRGGPGPAFTIRNDEASYAGHRTLFSALTYSDNTVFARVGLEDGPNARAALNNVAHYAHDFGITTDVSRNPAMTIGGLYTGVTTLDMAHAYSSIARGELVSGTLASKTCAGGSPVPTNKAYVVSQAVWPKNSCPGPIGITSVTNAKKHAVVVNRPVYRAVPGFSDYLDSWEKAMLRSVVTEGTGTAADIPNFVVYGKTGTTSSYHDAWFVGFTGPMAGLPDGITVAVWVGYDDENRSMNTQYGGKPVYGGTFPAVIFKTFVENAIGITHQEYEDHLHHRSEQSLIISTEANTSVSYALPSYGSSADTTTTPSTTSATGATGATGGTTTAPAGGATTPATGTTTTPPAAGPGGGAAAP